MSEDMVWALGLFIVVLALGWQSPTLRPWLGWFVAIVLIGLALARGPEIISQLEGIKKDG